MKVEGKEVKGEEAEEKTDASDGAAQEALAGIEESCSRQDSMGGTVQQKLIITV